MTSLTLAPEAGTAPAAPARRAHSRIPLRRIAWTELTKMFDTRSGFWLLASIAISATLATGAVILFGPDQELNYNNFAAAIGFPMTVILPMVAILSVTSEWSQRSGLTTFTLVPHRGRVITAKLLVVVAVAVVSIPMAFGIGALGNVLGTAIAGTDQVWNVTVEEAGYIVLGNVVGMLMGFTLGVLIRNSPGAIVAYFVYSLVLPTLSELLAASQQWYFDLRGWVDFHYASVALFDGPLSRTEWAQIGASSVAWLWIPLAVGLWMMLRSEVK